MLQEMFNINWLAVLVSGIAFMVIGFVWYTVFATPWSGYTGWTREKASQIPQNQMAISYGLTFIMALVSSFVLANFLKLANATDIGTGLMGAFFVWLGFTAGPAVANFAFERRPWGLWAIVTGNTLVNLLVASVILVLWK